jgi:hypothetical protein
MHGGNADTISADNGPLVDSQTWNRSGIAVPRDRGDPCHAETAHIVAMIEPQK